MRFTITSIDSHNIISFKYQKEFYVMGVKQFINYINWRVDTGYDIIIYDEKGLLDEA